MPSQTPITGLLENQFVRAGAGAGKTYSLTRSVLLKAKAFKEKNERWPRFAVSTFTVKATQELRERLVLLAQEEHPELLDFVSSSSFLKVSTLHGIFSSFLRSKAALFNLDPSFKVITEAESNQYLRGLIRDSLFSSKSSSLLNSFSFSEVIQLFKAFNAAYSEDESIKPISNKDLKYIYDEKLNFYKDCFLEMGEVCAEQPSEKWKDFGQSLTGFFSKPLNNLSSEDLYKEFLAIGKKPVKTKAIEPDLSDSLKELIAQFKKDFSSKKCDLLFWQDKELVLNQLNTYFKDVYGKWSDYKKTHGIMDIQDLELITYQLLKAEPEIAIEYSRDFDYWFVDEFQDTSPLQLKILDLMIRETPSYVVGDPQQSIYLFRGARSEVFLDKEKAFQDVIYMQDNYRSKEYLLSFINKVFGQRKFLSMEPIRKEASESSIKIYSLDEKDKEAVAVRNQILKWVDSGKEISDIAILARKKSDLIMAASALEEFNIPFNHLSVGRYSRKREILDADAVLRFLLNPHDNKNLILLLRSPYFFVSDDKIYQSVKTFDKKSSYWSQWDSLEENQSAIEKLKKYLERAKKESIYILAKEILKEEGYFDAAYIKDPSGAVEANLWKFLENIRTEARRPGFNPLKIYGGSNLLTENLQESDVEAPAPIESRGVNLLTIHASKGLQFKNVIVMGCGQGPQVSQSSAKKEALRVSDKKWSCSFKDENNQSVHSLFDEKYWKMFSKRELAEHERLFYVALTRAEDNLCIVYSDNKKSSWVETFKLNDIKSADGFIVDRVNLLQDDPVLAKESISDKSVIIRKPYKALSPKAKQSVSEILGDLKSSNEPDEEQTIEEKFELVKSSVLGQKIHKYFEVKKHHPQFLNDKYEPYWEKMLTKNELPFLEIINQGFVEWGFQVKTSKGTLEGQIDLWAEVDDVIWLVDYKTGSSRYKEGSFQQLDIYSWALSLHAQNKPVKQCLLYPVTGEVYIRDFKLKVFQSSKSFQALEGER